MGPAFKLTKRADGPALVRPFGVATDHPGIREVVYVNGSHAHVEYNKEQRELLEKLKIEL